MIEILIVQEEDKELLHDSEIRQQNLNSLTNCILSCKAASCCSNSSVISWQWRGYSTRVSDIFREF